MCTSVFVSGEPISDVHIRKTGVGPEMEDHKSQEASHWRPLVLRPPGTCIMHINYHFDALLVLHTRTENSDIFAAKCFSGVIASVLQKLLAALIERTEWGQVFIIDTLETLAKPKASLPPPSPPRPRQQHAARQLWRCHVRHQSHHGLPRTCNQLQHPACSFKEMQRTDTQMQRSGGAAIRHLNCGSCARHGSAV
jgi:hypothetical protein